jgi:hypothetical protein
LIALKVNFFGFIAFADVFLVLREPAACSSFAGRFGWIFFSAILDAPSLSRVPRGPRSMPASCMRRVLNAGSGSHKRRVLLVTGRV